MSPACHNTTKHSSSFSHKILPPPPFFLLLVLVLAFVLILVLVLALVLVLVPTLVPVLVPGPGNSDLVRYPRSPAAAAPAIRHLYLEQCRPGAICRSRHKTQNQQCQCSRAGRQKAGQRGGQWRGGAPLLCAAPLNLFTEGGAGNRQTQMSRI